MALSFDFDHSAEPAIRQWQEAYYQEFQASVWIQSERSFVIRYPEIIGLVTNALGVVHVCKLRWKNHSTLDRDGSSGKRRAEERFEPERRRSTTTVHELYEGPSLDTWFDLWPDAQKNTIERGTERASGGTGATQTKIIRGSASRRQLDMA
ncbi:hypothetical protein BU26DRAFT_504142 [Trematosphaeria pertusa]|uniref:Uncharacterized protein n=1 Tax=Trematosphaeria pertusa TaxID=390896 RepID=A0A6A6IHN2_9PLEO|nr:uncharacterized protein BU26DRAFT_504142 [Trematosphaeria pertusa]KAF2249687.1 hypothetical protein BU26DRAFT_504142 [Trematosphaeria pertusa]